MKEVSEIKIIETTNAPLAIGPYSQGVQVGDFVFTSGQIPLTKDGELVNEGVEKQTHQVILNVKSVLEAANTTLSNIIKVTLFIKNMEQFDKINEVYRIYFTEHQPARSCVEVSRLPKDVLVEMEVIAKKDA